ncbi:MAG: hypothetical protein JKX76_02285 [Colwellia sp.]|nr:hypothetical protein [Colwellia sp.]
MDNEIMQEENTSWFSFSRATKTKPIDDISILNLADCSFGGISSLGLELNYPIIIYGSNAIEIMMSIEGLDKPTEEEKKIVVISDPTYFTRFDDSISEKFRDSVTQIKSMIIEDSSLDQFYEILKSPLLREKTVVFNNLQQNKFQSCEFQYFLTRSNHFNNTIYVTMSEIPDLSPRMNITFACILIGSISHRLCGYRTIAKQYYFRADKNITQSQCKNILIDKIGEMNSTQILKII